MCRTVLWLLAGLLLPGVPTGLYAEEAAYREHELKAAFLFSFTKYIEWPTARFASADSPIGIGLVCDKPLKSALEEIVRGRRVNGRAVEVHALADPAEARGEHLVFVCTEHEGQLDATLHAVQGAAVVVVGESERSWRAGVTVNLVRVGDKLRFSIDVLAAQRAGVKVSSDLQKLALVLRRGGATP